MEQYRNCFNLTNKIAIVTGATGIIGSELCKALASHGARIILIDINESAITDLVTAINNTYESDKATGYVCDVSDASIVQDIIPQVIQKYSHIDILYNNAATKTDNLNDFFTPITNYSLDVWRKIMAVNLDGMFLMAQAVGAHMLNAKQGVIVQTASIYSLLGPDQRIYDGSYYLEREINTPAVYTTSKAGVIGLTKHLATIWGPSNIRVNAVCPGGVASGQNDTFSNKYSARVPLGRMASTADIIGPMLFLASDAARYITGQVLCVDGGLSAW